jgi:hypothetical protein
MLMVAPDSRKHLTSTRGMGWLRSGKRSRQSASRKCGAKHLIEAGIGRANLRCFFTVEGL